MWGEIPKNNWYLTVSSDFDRFVFTPIVCPETNKHSHDLTRPARVVTSYRRLERVVEEDGEGGQKKEGGGRACGGVRLLVSLLEFSPPSQTFSFSQLSRS